MGYHIGSKQGQAITSETQQYTWNGAGRHTGQFGFELLVDKLRKTSDYKVCKTLLADLDEFGMNLN